MTGKYNQMQLLAGKKNLYISDGDIRCDVP